MNLKRFVLGTKNFDLQYGSFQINKETDLFGNEMVISIFDERCRFRQRTGTSLLLQVVDFIYI